MTTGTLILILLICLPLSIIISAQVSFIMLNRDIEIITKRAIKKALYEVYEGKKNE